MRIKHKKIQEYYTVLYFTIGLSRLRKMVVDFLALEPISKPHLGHWLIGGICVIQNGMLATYYKVWKSHLMDNVTLIISKFEAVQILSCRSIIFQYNS